MVLISYDIVCVNKTQEHLTKEWKNQPIQFFFKVVEIPACYETT